MPVSYYQSPIGTIRITVTDSYVSEVHFMADEELPVSEVSPDADSHPLLHQCKEELIEYFAGQRRQFDLPVYQEGSSFQQRVWGELTGIPFGKVISYMEMAVRLGDPKVIRAAASTNGKNQIAIIVPCHRVVGGKGDMVGYAGGIWRKRWLLDHEKKIAHGVLTLF